MMQRKSFRAIYFVYLILLALVGLFGALYRPVGTSFERGYALYFPGEDATMDRSFSVNGNVYAKEDILSAQLMIESEGDAVAYPIQREEITYKDEVLHTLSTFKMTVEVPSDGDYRLWVRATDPSGTTIDYPSRNIHVEQGGGSAPFVTFSTVHLITLGVVALTMLALLIFASRHKNEKAYHTLAYITCAIIIISDFSFRLLLTFRGQFKASYDMPLHMCDVSGFLMPLLLFSKPSKMRDNLYNLMFIWGIGGAMMALLTPEMRGYAYPSYYYFNFFFKHGALVFGVLLITFMLGKRPNIKRLPLILLISNILIAIIYGINALIRFIPPFEVGNYLFIAYPPTGGSAIDMMVPLIGPSPWYIIGFNVLGVVVYTLLWIPFKLESIIKRRWSKKKPSMPKAA